jgi:hypothetical protein
MTEARERIAAILAAHLADAPLPEPPARRARELRPETQRNQRRRAARDKRARRADAVERLQAQLSRAATAAGEPYRPALRIPGRTWSMAAAVVADRSGRTAGCALATLPLALRHRARAELGDLRPLLARYRAALLVALHQLSRPSRARRRGRRVVSGFSRGALSALLRAPADGARLSVSRVYGRAMNAQPIVPWLADRGLLSREQPGRGARGVPRGPSGYALGLYYLDGDPEQLAPELLPELRRSRGPVTLAELLARPPD